MATSPFVKPKQVRLALADVLQKRYDALLAAKPKFTKDIKKWKDDGAALLQQIAYRKIGGDWVEVKAELSAGEAREAFTDMISEATAGEAWKLDPRRVGISKLLQYLVSWSFLMDPDGDEVAPLNEDSLRLMDIETFNELVALVDWHDEQAAAKREARKNDLIGESKSRAISPSPSVVTGESTGFVN
jgi:hypothetical protein